MTPEQRAGREEIERFAVKELQAHVEEFNARFAEWQERFGLVVNFSWRYSRHEDGAKSLDIQSVDRIVFRTPPPSPQHLADILGDEEPTRL